MEHFLPKLKEVTAAVIVRDGRVLITRRGPECKLAGYWEFPGGKVEPGETRQQCLERELLEELGVISHAGEEIAESEFHYDHGSFLIVAIETIMNGEEITLKDHDKLAWVTMSELGEYRLAPADVPLAESIRQRYE